MKAFSKHLNTIVLGVVLTIVTLTLIDPAIPIIKNAVQRIEGIVYDIRLNSTLPNKPRESDHNIFIVDIDEASLQEEGRWPWSRNKIKQMVTNLADAGVVVVGFDVFFAEPEVNPLDSVLANTLGQSALNLDKAALAQLREQLDADTALSQVLSDTDVVLGVLFQDDADAGELNPSVVTILDEDVEQVQSVLYKGKVANIDILRENAMGQGFINSSPDDDGFIRRASLLIEHNGALYPSLALETARLYTLSEQIELETEALPHTNVHSQTAVRFGVTRIPTDEFGRVLVPFRGGQKSFPYYSAADILHNRLPQELLESGVALVGTSAVGLDDLRATAVGIQYPGVEVHANVLEGILQPELLSYRPDWWLAALVIQVILIGLILSFSLPFLGPVYMALTGVTALVLVIGFNIYMWNNKVELPLVQPVLLVVLITVYNLARGFFTENSNKQQIKSMFDQYVPPAHIDQMLDDPDSVTLEGERKEMSVLFSDIRSFTSISEKLTANELKDMLNEYFSPITKSIFEHNGTIDKYVGDMVMAFWGAPLDDPNHAHNAIIGGFDMLDLTARLRDEFVAKGWPAIRVGIGINTGEMNVGDMGSEYRRAYTVLGDAVNLGSRLEGLTKFYGLEFLVSEFTKAQAEKIVYRPVDKVKVKGKDEAVAIYEPVCPIEQLTDTLKAEISLLEQSYQYYLQQQWDLAEKGYVQLLNDYGERYLYNMYLERITTLRETNLPQDWDGSFTHTSK